jgi:hypothetical protein
MRRSELLREDLRVAPLRVWPWLRYLSGRRAYRLLGEEELRATRRSDTVFIFGSGSSLNDVSGVEWESIAQHDTLGFNWFVHQAFVRCDYHLIRGIPDDDRDPSVWRPQLEDYFDRLCMNPRFANTVYLVHTGFRAINGNRAIGFRYLPLGSRVFRWRSNKLSDLPTTAFAQGLAHGESTLQECVNFAFLVGWKRIVLAGVDLYDRRYFWLPREEARSVDRRRGASSCDAHARAGSGMIDQLAGWRVWLRRSGVELLVYDERSLLAGPLPVFDRPPGARLRP